MNLLNQISTARSENNFSQILDVLRIDDKEFSVTINLYFGVLWDELRLDIGWVLNILKFLRTDVI